MKVTRQAMQELIDKTFANKDAVELNSSVMKGFNHIFIRNEVLTTFRKLYGNTIPDFREAKNRISLELDRNDMQVGYYLSELKYENIITYTYSRKKTQSEIYSEKIRNYLQTTSNHRASIYEVAKATGIIVSSIHQAYHYYSFDYTIHDEKTYDTKGRHEYTIVLK